MGCEVEKKFDASPNVLGERSMEWRKKFVLGLNGEAAKCEEAAQENAATRRMLELAMQQIGCSKAEICGSPPDGEFAEVSKIIAEFLQNNHRDPINESAFIMGIVHDLRAQNSDRVFPIKLKTINAIDANRKKLSSSV